MNFLFITISYKNICKLIEIKYFDKLTFQDIHYTVSRECNLRDPIFHTSNGLPIKNNFLSDYVQNFAQDSNFVLFVTENSITNDEQVASPIIVNSFQIQRNHHQTSPIIQPVPPNLNYIPEETSPQNDFHSKEELLNFLKSNPICCIILASYQKTNDLSGSDRTKMCKSIVQHLLFNHPNRILSRNDLNNIITLIIELFPNEKRETYLNKTSRAMTGKLHDAYNNYRGILAKQGIIKRRPKQQPVDNKSINENFQTDDTTMNGVNSIYIVNELLANPNNSGTKNINNNTEKHLNETEILTQDNEDTHLNDIESMKDLKKILDNNNITKEIIRKYYKKKDLEYTDKIEMSKEIIKYYLIQDSQRILSTKHFENTSKFIAQIFPTEKSEFYYYQFNSTSNSGSGLLVDAYNYIKSINYKSLDTQQNDTPNQSKISSDINALKMTNDIVTPSQIKLEQYEMLENQPHRYFNFDDINKQQSNENCSQHSQLSLPRKRKSDSNSIACGCDDEQKRQKIVINPSENFTEKKTENILSFIENFCEVQKELFNDFFNKQQKLIQEEHEFQRNQNENIIKKFETQTNRILNNINMIFEKKCTPSPSVTTTSTTDDF